MPRKLLVAIVDDDALMRATTKDLLESAGFVAATFASAEALLSSRRLKRLACVIADMRMPGMTGLELHQRLLASTYRVPTILMSAYLNERVRAAARKARVTCCLGKPYSAQDLLACVRTAISSGNRGNP